MKNPYALHPDMLFAFLYCYVLAQAELIEAQKTIIELQKRIDALTPKDPPDHEVFWHIASNGVLSQEAATSDDLTLVSQFRQWNVDFAKKFIKPHVSAKVYSECVNQMTRGLPERIAELKSQDKAVKRRTSAKKPQKEPKQLLLIQ